MPITIGLLSSQQESFAHHEELSKLLDESDVFYVPLQYDLTNQQDLSDLVKRFDEDISNKHLVVTFRNIGYSLFLNSVESIPDQNDQSKMRISGKMIVDGICIQFLGCFDSYRLTRLRSDIQQINGVGRVQLDEDYYRELSSNQTGIDPESSDEKILVEQQNQYEIWRSIPTAKTRSRTISENILAKHHANNLVSSPPLSSRSRLHSPSHMPYPLRSPRTMTHVTKQQYQRSSPVNIDNSSISRSSGFHSAFMSPSSSGPNSFNENQIGSPPQIHHRQFLSPSIELSSSLNSTLTMPIEIPTSTTTTTNLSVMSVPHLTNIFPITQSHSLPTYFIPQSNIAYLSTSASNTNANMYFITHSNQLPVHLIAKLDTSILPMSNTHFSSTSHFAQEPMVSTLDKQHQPTETNKQFEEQLPLKKRRYINQSPSSPLLMELSHLDDDDISNESMKK